MDGARCEPIPSEPPFQPKPATERTQSGLAFHLGLPGNVTKNDVSNDTDATLGFNIRVDVPVVHYLLLGPLIQFGAWRPSVAGRAPSRSYYIDVDLFVRGRIPIELDSIALQVWGGVPIGLTFDLISDQIAPAAETFAVGWNVGILFGGAIHFTRKFGMFTEVGWMQHRMSHDHQVGSGSTDVALGQVNLNFGFLFAN